MPARPPATLPATLCPQDGEQVIASLTEELRAETTRLAAAREDKEATNRGLATAREEAQRQATLSAGLQDQLAQAAAALRAMRQELEVRPLWAGVGVRG